MESLNYSVIKNTEMDQDCHCDTCCIKTNFECHCHKCQFIVDCQCDICQFTVNHTSITNCVCLECSDTICDCSCQICTNVLISGNFGRYYLIYTSINTKNYWEYCAWF